MKIMDNTLINIGNNYLVFTFGNDDQEQYNSNRINGHLTFWKICIQNFNILKVKKY